MKTCNGCKYAEWNKTAAGRLHPSGDGKCCYEYKVPPLPAALYWLGGEPRPSGWLINRREEHKDHCPYWCPANAGAHRAEVADTVTPIVGCSHDWREPIDTQFCNEKYTEVKCTKCGMVGEKTIATGEVFFPAT